MYDYQQLIIYLDVIAFALLFFLFVILLKSGSLFKNN